MLIIKAPHFGALIFLNAAILKFMKKKMYILKTWTWDAKPRESTAIEPVKVRHPTELSVYIVDNPYYVPKGTPYITTSRLSAKKFNTKKQALKYGRKFGGCHVDIVWHYQKLTQNGLIDLWS